MSPSSRDYTAAEASLMLAEYEHLNHDLDKDLRVHMAMFLLAPKVGPDTLEELFERPLGQTFFRHISWLWHNAMVTAGLSRYWDTFVGMKNDGESLRECLLWLRERASKGEWALFSQRMGIPIFKKGQDLLNPYWWNVPSTENPTKYWTAGGVWDRRNGFTKILLLGEPVERAYGYNTFTKKLGPRGASRLEREVANLVNAEQRLQPHAVNLAVEAVRTLIPSYIRVKRRRVSYKTAAWFFQEKVPHPKGGFITHDQEASYAMKRTHRNGGYIIHDWLPAHEESTHAG